MDGCIESITPILNVQFQLIHSTNPTYGLHVCIAHNHILYGNLWVELTSVICHYFGVWIVCPRMLRFRFGMGTNCLLFLSHGHIALSMFPLADTGAK